MSANPFPFDFRSRPPTAALTGVVEQLWYARGTVPYTRDRIAPTGSTVAVLIFGDPIIERADDGAGPAVETRTGFVIGSHDRALVNEPTGKTHAVGIVTTPTGCEQVLGVRPTLLRGRVVTIEDWWHHGSEIREPVERDPGDRRRRHRARDLACPAASGLRPPGSARARDRGHVRYGCDGCWRTSTPART